MEMGCSQRTSVRTRGCQRSGRFALQASCHCWPNHVRNALHCRQEKSQQHSRAVKCVSRSHHPHGLLKKPYRCEPDQVIVNIKPPPANGGDPCVGSKDGDEETDAKQREGLNIELLSGSRRGGLCGLFLWRESGCRHDERQNRRKGGCPRGRKAKHGVNIHPDDPPASIFCFDNSNATLPISSSRRFSAVPCPKPEVSNNGPSYFLGCLIDLSPQWDCNGRELPKRPVAQSSSPHI